MSNCCKPLSFTKLSGKVCIFQQSLMSSCCRLLKLQKLSGRLVRVRHSFILRCCRLRRLPRLSGRLRICVHASMFNRCKQIRPPKLSGNLRRAEQLVMSSVCRRFNRPSLAGSIARNGQFRISCCRFVKPLKLSGSNWISPPVCSLVRLIKLPMLSGKPLSSSQCCTLRSRKVRNPLMLSGRNLNIERLLGAS